MPEKLAPALEGPVASAAAAAAAAKADEETVVEKKENKLTEKNVPDDIKPPKKKEKSRDNSENSSSNTSRRLVEYFLIVSSVPCPPEPREQRETQQRIHIDDDLHTPGLSLDDDDDDLDAPGLSLDDDDDDNNDENKGKSKDGGTGIMPLIPSNDSNTNKKEHFELNASRSVSSRSSSSKSSKGVKPTSPVKIKIMHSSSNLDSSDEDDDNEEEEEGNEKERKHQDEKEGKHDEDKDEEKDKKHHSSPVDLDEVSLSTIEVSENGEIEKHSGEEFKAKKKMSFTNMFRKKFYGSTSPTTSSTSATDASATSPPSSSSSSSWTTGSGFFKRSTAATKGSPAAGAGHRKTTSLPVLPGPIKSSPAGHRKTNSLPDPIKSLPMDNASSTVQKPQTKTDGKNDQKQAQSVEEKRKKKEDENKKKEENNERPHPGDKSEGDVVTNTAEKETGSNSNEHGEVPPQDGKEKEAMTSTVEGETESNETAAKEETNISNQKEVNGEKKKESLPEEKKDDDKVATTAPAADTPPSTENNQHESDMELAKDVIQHLPLGVEDDDEDDDPIHTRQSQNIFREKHTKGSFLPTLKEDAELEDNGEEEPERLIVSHIPSMTSTSQSSAGYPISHSHSTGSLHYLDAHEDLSFHTAMEEEVDITKIVKFKPQITSRYPEKNHPDTPLNDMVPLFCFSKDVIYPSQEYKMPSVHHFALTDGVGRRMYGTCLTVYEEYIPDPSESNECFELWWRVHRGEVHHTHDEDKKEDEDADADADEQKKKKKERCEITICPKSQRIRLYLPRVICLMSEWPYLTSFREYLTQLYKLSTMTRNLMKVPIERYVVNICSEVPAPPPGEFEVRLNVFPTGSSMGQDKIRFWAPPANQPISWVSLPNHTLFECLDVDNIIVAWYALALERKVLLVSSQCSLLTVCAEILCSFLFPMTWNHLYIPVLPRPLCTMLGAPMPYLCGVIRENLDYAMENVCGETMVIDLDRDVITAGSLMPELPPIPQRRLKRLEEGLKLNCGDVYWNTRGFNKMKGRDIEKMKKTMTEELFQEEVINSGNKVWEEKLCRFDDAFNLALTPDSHGMLVNDEKYGGRGPPTQSKWDKVQETFLLFYASVLKDYRKYISRGTGLSSFLPNHYSSINGGGLKRRSSCPELIDCNDEHFFYRDLFISAQLEEYKPFLREFCTTNQFDAFITKRLKNPEAAEAVFFDETIEAKKNQSKLRMMKVKTPYLLSARAHQKLKVIDAIQPNEEGLSSPNDVAGSSGEGAEVSGSRNTTYSYEKWPEQFDQRLYNEPRPIPRAIYDSFDRQESFRVRSEASSTSTSWSSQFFGSMTSSDSSTSPLRKRYSFTSASFYQKNPFQEGNLITDKNNAANDGKKLAMTQNGDTKKSDTEGETDSDPGEEAFVDAKDTAPEYKGNVWNVSTGNSFLDSAFGLMNTYFYCGNM